MGISECQMTVKTIIYWPGTEKDIKDIVKCCSTCIKLKFTQPPEPLMSHEVPHSPWQKNAADFMDWDHKTHLIIVDYFSKYPSLFHLHSVSAPAVTAHFTKFYTWKVPQEVFTDDSLSSPKNGTSSLRNIDSNTQHSILITNNQIDSQNSILEILRMLQIKLEPLLFETNSPLWSFTKHQLPVDCLHPQRSYTTGKQA